MINEKEEKKNKNKHRYLCWREKTERTEKSNKKETVQAGIAAAAPLSFWLEPSRTGRVDPSGSPSGSPNVHPMGSLSPPPSTGVFVFLGDGDVEDPPVVDGVEDDDDAGEGEPGRGDVDDDDDAGEGEPGRGDFVGYVGKFSVKEIVRVSI